MDVGGIQGSCACGDVTFETDASPYSGTSCYCKECAKLSGSGFLTFVHFHPRDVRWSRDPDIWNSSNVAERWYCSRCGSSIAMKYNNETDEVGIVITMIDSSRLPLPKIERHIFIAEKADWLVIPDDGAKRFDEHDVAFQAKFDKWKDQASEGKAQGEVDGKNSG